MGWNDDPLKREPTLAEVGLQRLAHDLMASANGYAADELRGVGEFVKKLIKEYPHRKEEDKSLWDVLDFINARIGRPFPLEIAVRRSRMDEQA